MLRSLVGSEMCIRDREVKADETGKVILNWQDPQSFYLKEIVIQETWNDQSTTIIVAKGVQTAILENRTKGQTYTYLVKARAIDGQESSGSSKSITIPLKGEIIEKDEGKVVLPENIKIGDLIKSSTSPAVYYIGSDNKKHLFINETVYRSWYLDFKNIKIISDHDLAEVATGKEVYIRPGTYLVKSAGNPKVYAVLPGGKLSWIKNEIIATALYGQLWNKKVLVLADDKLAQYALADNIDSAVHPNASLISYVGSKAVYYIENGYKRLVSSVVMSQSRFQDKFINKNIDPALTYLDGANLEAIVDIGYLE